MSLVGKGLNWINRNIESNQHLKYPYWYKSILTIVDVWGGRASYKYSLHIISGGCSIYNNKQLLIATWHIYTIYCKHVVLFHASISHYSSTLYVGMASKNNAYPYISIASDDLKYLIIYRQVLIYAYLFICSAFMNTNIF